MRYVPLAERMRPSSLDEVVGQEHITGDGAVLRLALERQELPSLILWGPPGSGKTTLARLVAQVGDATYVQLSAVQAGVKEVRRVVEEARRLLGMLEQQRTYLFLDEIHRFNKAQQDILLPHVEQGIITLIGATTENPSFELNAALLSRCRVMVLKPLDETAIMVLLKRAVSRAEQWYGTALDIEQAALQHIADYAEGDARRALTALELAAEQARSRQTPVDSALIHDVLDRRLPRYDRGGEEHYNIISAFIKSMRGSDPDAAVYWMARMLEGGEDPRFILRRMIIFASEDIGGADPTALAIAVHALHAFDVIGLPEGVLPMTQAATHLAMAPKSNTVIKAYYGARDVVRKRGSLPVPLHLRNAPTSLLKQLDYGKDYQYPHDHPDHVVSAQYLPDVLVGTHFYEPSDQGRERVTAERLASLRALRD